MKQELVDRFVTWWRMLSPQEKQDAFFVLLKRLFQIDELYIPDAEESAEMISEGMGDVDAMAPYWDDDTQPILKVGR